MAEDKVCKICKKVKSIGMFYNRFAHCKKCHKKKAGRWHQKHPAYHKQIQKKFHCIWQKKWQQANPTAVRAIDSRCHAKRYRSLNWVKLYPNPFDDSVKIHWHHSDDEHVVAIPKDLHQLYYNNDEQHRINLSYITAQIYGGDVHGRLAR